MVSDSLLLGGTVIGIFRAEKTGKSALKSESLHRWKVMLSRDINCNMAQSEFVDGGDFLGCDVNLVALNVLLPASNQLISALGIQTGDESVCLVEGDVQPSKKV